MAERVVWDRYETALLIDMFWKIENEVISKTAGVQQLSQQLRQMAINQGKVIDDIYRNCNGIVMQLASIQKLFFPQRSGLSESKLFIEMVDLYKSNRTEFDIILNKAKKMCMVAGEEKNNREDFSKWLNAHDVKIPPVTLILDSFDKASDYAIKRNLLKKTIWELVSINEFNTLRAKLLGMKLFRLMHPNVAKTMDKTWRYYVSFLEEILQDSKKLIKETNKVDSSIKDIVTPVVPQSDVDSSVSDISEKKIEGAKPQGFGATYYPPAVKSKKDKELFKKYPDILLKTYDLFANSIRGYYTVDTLMIKLEKRATFKIVEEILDNVSWLRKDGIKYFFESESPIDVAKDLPEQKLSDVSLSEQGVSEQPIEVIDIKSNSIKVDESWEEPIIKEDDFVQPITIERTETKDISFADWLLNVQGMPINSVRSYTSAINGISSYAYFNAWVPVPLLEIEDNEQLKIVIGLLLSHPDFCAYNVGQHNRFSAALRKYLVYRTGSDEVVIRSRNTSRAISDNQKSKYADGIISLLDKRFKYGFRLESPIDLMRARQFAKDEGVDLPENDDELKREISNAGISIDGRVYVIGDDTITELKDMLQRIVSEGHTLIFYETFRERESEWFESNHILTDEMLKELLVKHQGGFFYGKNFMSSIGKTTEIDGIVDELKRVWGEQVLLTFDEMDERLPYIPPERVRHALSMHKDMIWNSEATYTITDRVVISENEAQIIHDFAINACDMNGFSSMSDLPLGVVVEENYELSIHAIYEAVYLMVLQKDFQLNGKIITRYNTELSAVDLVKSYCADKEECSLDELLDKVIELTGASNRQIAFEAGYSAMVRVEQNRFVADNRVVFNVEETDAFLSELIKEDFTAIRSITAFAMFPICGQAWTSYLLESYCYKYSKKFRLRNMNFNDKNAGIICKRSVDLDYKEMCAIALAKSTTELTIEAAGRYLCDAGYLAKSKYARMGDIVERAREIREEN